MKGGIGGLVMIAALAGQLAAAGTAAAKTVYVDGVNGSDGNNGLDWTTAKLTINGGIAAAAAGDTVLVSNGTYTVATTGGNIVTVNKSLTIESVKGRDATFIDGGYPAVSNRCILTSVHNVTVRGFTLRNGCVRDDHGAALYSSAYGSTGLLLEACGLISNRMVAATVACYGAAVRNNGGSIVLRGCLLQGNRAEREGTYTASYSVLQGCRVEGCTVVDNYAYRGGILDRCDAFDSIITANQTASEGNGGAVSLWGTSSKAAELVNCAVTHNYCESTVSGGGVRHHTGSALIRNCLIAGNRAVYGGGISVNGPTCVVENCTMVANEATSDYGTTTGGGIGKTASCQLLQVINTIIYHNKCGNSVNTNKANFCADVVTNLSHCCSTTNAAAGGALPGTNNITADPQFVNWGSGYGTNWSGGDLRLIKTSPCLDAGVDLSWMLESGAADLADGPRIRYKRVDMGAYETLVPKGTIFSGK